jgi:ubiquitin C-terminal hydrolase
MNTYPFYRVGLVNLGNTCFANSCIQVMQQMYELQNLVESAKPMECVDTLILNEWNMLRKAMQQQHGTLSPNRFFHILQQVAAQKNRELFTGWAQNDISEFLLFLIECMHNSIAKPLHIKVNGNPENTTDNRAILCYTFLQSIYAKEHSKIHDMFYGMYVTEILNKNGNQILSVKPEHFFILDLQLFQNDRVCNTLYDCFDLFVSSEDMVGENAWFNETTQEKEDIKRQVSFWNFPNILVIILKRFSPDGQRKLQTLIDFPLMDLNLAKYVNGYQAETYRYDLFGVCNHMGNVKGGHYTAFVKNTVNEWYHYNDTVVEQVTDFQRIVSPAAYCLFYRKK